MQGGSTCEYLSAISGLLSLPPSLLLVPMAVKTRADVLDKLRVVADDEELI